MNPTIHYLNKANEMAKIVNNDGRDIVTMIAVLGGFTYTEVANALAGEPEQTAIAMLATQIQLLETKAGK